MHDRLRPEVELKHKPRGLAGTPGDVEIKFNVAGNSTRYLGGQPFAGLVAAFWLVPACPTPTPGKVGYGTCPRERYAGSRRSPVP